jgi:hypothetical protein
MKVTNICLLIPLFFLFSSLGCQNDGPIAPGGADTPPAWVSTVGVINVVSGESAVTVYWGEAVDFQDPPVEYLVYEDLDDNPFDQTPLVRGTNEPYTFTNLAVGTEYWFGVRCRDSAKPPHVDDNDKVLSARTADHGWARTWGGKGDEEGYDIAVDGSGNVYVTGWFGGTDVDFNPDPLAVDLHSSVGSWDIFVSKYDATGTFLWARTWGGDSSDWGTSVAVDSFGNAYVTGFFYSASVDFSPDPSVVDPHLSNGLSDIFLSKFDPSGTFAWARTWGGSNYDGGEGVAVDASGNIYLTGSFSGASVDFNPDPIATDPHSSVGDADVFLSRFDSSGTFMWARTWGGDTVSSGLDVAVDGSGNAYATGIFKGTSVDFNPDSTAVDLHSSNGQSDIFLSKFDSTGTFAWARTWGGSNYDNGLGVAVDGSGGVYVTGYFLSKSVDLNPDPTAVDFHWSHGLQDVFLSKFDSSGAFVWARTWGGTYTDYGYGVAADGDGNVYVTGSFQRTVDFDPDPAASDTYSSNGYFDCYLSKFDSSGTYLRVRIWGGKGHSCSLGVAVGRSGNAYVTGDLVGTSVDFNPDPIAVDLHSSIGKSDAFLVKFLPDGNW